MDLEMDAPVATQEGPAEITAVVENGAIDGVATEGGSAEGGSQNGRGRTREGGRNGRGGRRNRESTREGRAREGEELLEPRPDVGPALIVAELETMPEEQLHELAREYEIQGYTRIKRPDLIIRLLQARTEREGTVFGDGILEIIEDGFGFLRGARLLPGPDDIYVSQSQIRRFGLRTGDRVSGQVRPPKDNEKFFSLLRVEAVNGTDPET
ncbi:MAG TPA: Rho termination factor N-terminal domain-containing protein, partial [Thermomicrobiales bacterium]|nr:Rho termination factor N-terminal domain-containing protein [Thermomicrobiales bacterium]